MGKRRKFWVTCGPIDVTWRIYDPLSYYPSMTMRLCWQALAVATIFSTSLSAAEPDTDLLAKMSGKCSILRIAGRDYTCRAVAFFHNEEGRANFTIALDDPTDETHIITFSGENGRRSQDNLYQLPIDRILLNSKDRPKGDGLPVPFVELSTGMCKQVGNFATKQVSSISCTAMDKDD